LFLLPCNRYAAVKEYQKDLVRRGVSRDGAPITENPVLELTVQQALGVPGHPSVLPVVNCFEDETKIYACLPLVRGGELFDFVSGHGGPMAEDTVREMMRPGFEAAHYCHTRGFAHRDISLENFLLGGEHRDRPILIDFGLACRLVPDGQGGYLPIERTHVVGKKNYMAPEVRDPNVTSYDAVKIDIWSLGVCVFIMLFGFPPWQVASVSDDHYYASVVNVSIEYFFLVCCFLISCF
jgi:serine/threonine protein kinase